MDECDVASSRVVYPQSHFAGIALHQLGLLDGSLHGNAAHLPALHRRQTQEKNYRDAREDQVSSQKDAKDEADTCESC